MSACVRPDFPPASPTPFQCRYVTMQAPLERVVGRAPPLPAPPTKGGCVGVKCPAVARRLGVALNKKKQKAESENLKQRTEKIIDMAL